MTRKQAIQLALHYLNEISEPDDNLCKAKSKLQEMLNGFPGKIWDDSSIRSAIQRFIKENGRTPTVRELDSVEYLPTHTSVFNCYKITAGKWLHENYPTTTRLNWRVSYENYTEQDFRIIFIKEYKTILPDSSLEYNRLRSRDTPSWQYIAKNLSVSTWKELKKMFVEELGTTRKGERRFVVSSQILGFENMTAYPGKITD